MNKPRREDPGTESDSTGNLYGTTSNGGAKGYGTVFSLTHLTGPTTATTTTLTSSPNPVNAGANVAFTATVSPSAGSGFPTGNVTFSADGLSEVGTTALVCGAASISFEDALSLGIGSTTITATYKPAGPAYSSSSAALSQTIYEPGVVLTNGNNTLSGNDTISGTVSATSFVGNGAGLTGVAASGLACAGCVGNSQLNINYAGSTTQGGPATNALSAQNALLFGGLRAQLFRFGVRSRTAEWTGFTGRNRQSSSVATFRCLSGRGRSGDSNGLVLGNGLIHEKCDFQFCGNRGRGRDGRYYLQQRNWFVDSGRNSSDFGGHAKQPAGLSRPRGQCRHEPYFHCVQGGGAGVDRN